VHTETNRINLVLLVSVTGGTGPSCQAETRTSAAACGGASCWACLVQDEVQDLEEEEAKEAAAERAAAEAAQHAALMRDANLEVWMAAIRWGRRGCSGVQWPAEERG
jgi:hypothetical protein